MFVATQSDTTNTTSNSVNRRLEALSEYKPPSISLSNYQRSHISEFKPPPPKKAHYTIILLHYSKIIHGGKLVGGKHSSLCT